MKKVFFLLIPLFLLSLNVFSQTEVELTNSGILIPRMTDVQRDTIFNPATGLMVFVTSNNRFYYYSGSSWLIVGGVTSQLADTDGDTKVQVEKNTDEDIIRFDMEGVEYFKMDKGRLEILNTEGSIFIGAGAGANDDGSDNQNLAVGDSALYSNTEGNYNTVFGIEALFVNTTGIENTATGWGALHDNVDGSYNTAYGSIALYDNTSGAENTGFGWGALAYNTSGDYNTACGSEALYYNETGSDNTGLGWGALDWNTTGNDNTATGSEALYYNETGSYNTANGYQALTENSNGYDNTATGWGALYKNTSGDYNTANGSESLSENTTGSGNTGLGYSALDANTSGMYNTAVGYEADVGTGGLTNATAIDANAAVYRDSSLVLGNMVNVGIGVDTPNRILTIVKHSPTDPIADAWTTYSSRRWKTNIHTIDGALETVGRLRGVTYDWKETGTQDIGLIAEEVGEVLPEIVQYESNGIDAQSVDYSRIVPVLIEAVKELRRENKKLNDKQEKMADEIEKMKAALMIHAMAAGEKDS